MSVGLGPPLLPIPVFITADVEVKTAERNRAPDGSPKVAMICASDESVILIDRDGAIRLRDWLDNWIGFEGRK